jgi:hypothetical protein
MALGATHYNWHPAVRTNVNKVLHRWPRVTANTYVDHPWPSWDRFSVDFWGPRGRGDQVGLEDGYEIRSYLMHLPGSPYIRHTIYRHDLWTSFGGHSYWAADDHSGGLRHLHVTYWKL